MEDRRSFSHNSTSLISVFQCRSSSLSSSITRAASTRMDLDDHLLLLPPCPCSVPSSFFQRNHNHNLTRNPPLKSSKTPNTTPQTHGTKMGQTYSLTNGFVYPIGASPTTNATARMGIKGSMKRRGRRVVDVIVNIVCGACECEWGWVI